jgi:hypothetical protein
MVANKPHPLKGRKQSPETIAKRKKTLAAKRAAREAGELKSPLEKPKLGRRPRQPDTRSHEQLLRDVKEATWCLEKAVASKRQAIAAGQASLTDVTDEETFMYMAKRYLEGGLR